MAHISTQARKYRKQTRDVITQRLKSLTGKTTGWSFVNPTNNENVTLDALGVEGMLYSIIPAAREAEYKYGAGVARLMLSHEQINNNYRDASELNDIIKIISSAHTHEWDPDLRGCSVRELIDFFHSESKYMDNADREEISKMDLTPNDDYVVVEIPDYETATKYHKYTTWCITSSQQMFDTYSAQGMNKVYFLLHKEFEKCEAKNLSAKDDYGLSMISVIVRPQGALGFCTGRYNHGHSGNDKLLSTTEVSELIGRNFYDVFLPKTGEEIEKVIFKSWEAVEPDEVAVKKGWRRIKKVSSASLWWESANVYTYYDPDKRYLVFDQVGEFDQNGLAEVKLNNKYNFINKEGEIVFHF